MEDYSFLIRKKTNLVYECQMPWGIYRKMYAQTCICMCSKCMYLKEIHMVLYVNLDVSTAMGNLHTTKAMFLLPQLAIMDLSATAMASVCQLFGITHHLCQKTAVLVKVISIALGK